MDGGNELTLEKDSWLNLRHLNSKFRREINQTKALLHFLDEAHDAGETTAHDCERLQGQLDSLVVLKNEYETLVLHFKNSFGSKSPQEAQDVKKALDILIPSFSDVKLSAAKLMLRLNRHNRKSEVFAAKNLDLQHEEVRDNQDCMRNAEEEKEEEEDGGTSDTNMSEQEETDSIAEEGMCRVPLPIQIIAGLLIVIMFYFGLGTFINYVVESWNESDVRVVTSKPTFTPDDTTCGADSFMLRDSVCDEASNIEKCLYDGGDCCLENKDRTLCRKCICFMDVDEDELKEKFEELEIKPVNDPDSLKTLIVDNNRNSLVEVEDVSSVLVCSALCLEHEKSGELNVWHYEVENQTCRCGWVGSTLCPSKMANLNWIMTDVADLKIDTVGIGFLQLRKTVPCDCLADGFLIKGEISAMSKVDHDEGFPLAMSLWHCWQMCDFYQDCVWVTWKKFGEAAGECRMMMELPSNSSITTYNEVDPSRVSAAKDCNIVGLTFERFSTNRNRYQFVCPGYINTTSGKHTKLVEEQDAQQFLIYLDGSSVVTFKLDLVQDTFVECAHPIQPPEPDGLVDATGGVLKMPDISDIDDPIIVVCGGQLFKENKPSDKCMILNKQKDDQFLLSTNGILNRNRFGAASVVIDNGNTLWLTGGMSSSAENIAVRTSELVNMIDISSGLIYDTNGQGPTLPEAELSDHCITKIGPNVALLTGGASVIISSGKREFPDATTWSVDIHDFDSSWKPEARLNMKRTKHVCGVLGSAGGSGGGQLIVVVAGGTNEFGSILDSVETLNVTEDNDETTFGSEWIAAPKLPKTLSDAASATTSDHGAFYIIGGTIDIIDNSDGIFKLSCSNVDMISSCFWTKIDNELRTTSTRGLAMLLPSKPMVSREYSNSQNCSESAIDGHESILMVTGGWSGYEILGDTEAFVVSQNQSAITARCRVLPSGHTQNMHALDEATGSLLTLNTIKTPIICGGTIEQKGNDNCYFLHHNRSSGLFQPEPVKKKMSRSRRGAASVSLHDGTLLWITGGLGLSSIVTNTSEWINISTDTRTFEEGIPLPRPMFFHCLAMPDNMTALLYGGLENDAASIEEKALQTDTWLSEKCNIQKKCQWTRSAPMTLKRYASGCGVIREDITASSTSGSGIVIVAAGGTTLGDLVTNRVELYKDGAWVEGPQLPVAVSGAASAGTEDRSMLFLAGGIATDSLESEAASTLTTSSSVFSLRCVRAICEWIKQDIELVFARFSPVAIVVPPSKPDVTFISEFEFEACRPLSLGNGQCDAINNNYECEFDGGDCCTFDDEDCLKCYGDYCTCHATGKRMCGVKCLENRHDDTYCNGENNNEKCGYDGGDCCQAHLNWCIGCVDVDCICHETGKRHCKRLFETCVGYDLNTLQRFGDMICDDDLNTAECGFDGGDCCGIHVVTWTCNDCECLEPFEFHYYQFIDDIFD